MPRGDGTGAIGTGPMTGRGEGCCAGQVTSGAMNLKTGRGFGGHGFGGRGRGGHGQGHRFRAMGLPGWARAGWGGLAFDSTLPCDRQIQVLEHQANCFRGALSETQKRLEELRSAHGANSGEKE
jgi:hypothetical protein